MDVMMLDVVKMGALFLLFVYAMATVIELIVEVIKSFVKFKSAEAVNGFVCILSIVLSTATLVAYWQIRNYVLEWYILVAFVITGLFIGFVAMFGYDKLLCKIDPVFKKVAEYFKGN